MLGDVLRVRHGRDQKAIQRADGRFPILATGGEIGRTDTPLYSKPSVLIGRKGTIDRPQYMDQPFWTVDTLFYTEIKGKNSPYFLFCVFQMIDWRSFNEASGVPSLSSKTIERIAVVMPRPEEQAAIAESLANLDHEVELLQQRLSKFRAIKDGMMQQLLTGRVKLA
ncbi:type I restriction endonuclease subunit S [Novosphingobium sp. Leaf2]|nr:type I restriction endonuclease subunit S [Novosphingobium sp. Leaf2]